MSRVTIELTPLAAAMLQQAATETGETVERLAEELLAEAAAHWASCELDAASEGIVRARLEAPGPFASPERVAAVLAKFR